MYLLIELGLVLAPFIALLAVLDHSMNHYCDKIERIDINSQHRNATEHARIPDRPPRPTHYFVTGGSGYKGSWITRYLLLRHETHVTVVDRRQVPADLIKHGAAHARLDLTRDGQQLDELFAGVPPSADIVVYHCAVTAKRLARVVDKRVETAAANAEMAAVLVTALEPLAPRAYIVAIGDALTRQRPVSWLSLSSSSWKTSLRRHDSVVPLPSAYISDYAYSKNIGDSAIRASPVSSTLVEPLGFVSGHASDSLLSPALRYRGAVIHSWGVPVTLLHAEDLARAALTAEMQLRHGNTAVLNRVCTISTGEYTTLEAIADYVGAQRPLRKMHIQPVLVLFLAYLVAAANWLVAAVTRSPVTALPWQVPLLCGTARSLTPDRFTLLQAVRIDTTDLSRQLPGFIPHWTTRGIIDDTLDDLKRRDQ